MKTETEKALVVMADGSEHAIAGSAREVVKGIEGALADKRIEEVGQIQITAKALHALLRPGRRGRR